MQHIGLVKRHPAAELGGGAVRHHVVIARAHRDPGFAESLQHGGTLLLAASWCMGFAVTTLGFLSVLS